MDVYVDTVEEKTFNNGTYTAQVPYNLSQIFSSARCGVQNTLSGPFDICYQQHILTSNQAVDKGELYIAGSFRPLDSLIVHNTIEPIEGLIVDTTKGGLGYRNHTAPARLPNGGRWAEDITWLETLVECVDTNLSVQFTVGYSDYAGWDLKSHQVRIKDRDGFSDLPLKGNFFDTADPQANPDLRARASQLAYFHNGILMWSLGLGDENTSSPRNVTRNGLYHVPQSPGNSSVQTHAYRPDSVRIPPMNNVFSGLSLNTSSDMFDLNRAHLYYEDTLSQWTAEQLHNSTAVIECGAILTAPQRVDGGAPHIYNSGS